MTDRAAPAARTRRRGPGVRGLVVVALAAALLASCSGSSGGTDASPRPPTTSGADGSSTTANRPAPKAFTGSVEDFYRLPEDPGTGPPGEVVRTMAVDAPKGRTGLRILYRSTDAEGRARLATGLVYYPDASAPTGGWPVVAWTHGTSGLAPACAPSRNPAPPPAYGVDGVQVAADYLGLGPVGEIHPYLSAADEANAVLDAVAAARSLPAAHAGKRWVVAGVSQGGHAALVTGERAAARLPGMTLLGTVALAPGSELGSTYGDGLQIKIITTMVLIGLAAEDPKVDPADYLSPKALAASEVIKTGCMGDIIKDMPGPAAAADYWKVDPTTSPVGRAWVKANDPGQVVSKAPILVVQGEADILVVPARTKALMARLCRIGQVAQEVDIPGADHDTVVDRSLDQVSAWIQDRFAGQAAADGC